MVGHASQARLLERRERVARAIRLNSARFSTPDCYVSACSFVQVSDAFTQVTPLGVSLGSGSLIELRFARDVCPRRDGA